MHYGLKFGVGSGISRDGLGNDEFYYSVSLISGEQGFDLSIPLGRLNPDRLKAVPVYRLATLGADSMCLDLTSSRKAFLSGYIGVTIKFLELAGTPTFNLTEDGINHSYIGNFVGIRAKLAVISGTTTKISLIPYYPENYLVDEFNNPLSDGNGNTLIY